MGLKIIDGIPSSISKFIRESDGKEIGQHHKDNPPKCLVCGKTMHEVLDKMNNEYTGFNWRCDCMPKNVVMSLL